MGLMGQGTPHRGSVTPRPSAAASPSAPSPSVTAVSGAGSVLGARAFAPDPPVLSRMLRGYAHIRQSLTMLDVPVVAAADSALDELLAE
ncbi:unnamed protein product, partial [Symbiodinium sp. KB8]